MPHEIVDAFADRKRRDVLRETWGHLAPKPNRPYQGWMIFAHTAHGDCLPIDYDFQRLDSSPWLFEAIMDFINEHTDEEGIYRWEGIFKMDRQGNCTWRGLVTRIKASELRARWFLLPAQQV